MWEDVVFDALRSVSKFNSTVVGLSVESAAFKVSRHPDHYWKAIQERRRGIPGAPICSYEEWWNRTPEWLMVRGLSMNCYVLPSRTHVGT